MSPDVLQLHSCYLHVSTLHILHGAIIVVYTLRAFERGVVCSTVHMKYMYVALLHL